MIISILVIIVNKMISFFVKERVAKVKSKAKCQRCNGVGIVTCGVCNGE